MKRIVTRVPDEVFEKVWRALAAERSATGHVKLSLNDWCIAAFQFTAETKAKKYSLAQKGK